MAGLGKKFKIIAVPPGQAPDWVRQEWIGLELPMCEPEAGMQVGVLGGKPENLGGFEVDGGVAIELLSQKSPAAANWWLRNAPHVILAKLVFSREVCREVS